MREHMVKVVECVSLLPEFFEALHNGDHDQVMAVRDKVYEAEHAADTIKNEMRDNLPRSIFMPINRRDLLDILDLQDSIADTAQDIVTVITNRNMISPEELQEKIIQYLAIAQDTCLMAGDISQDFDILIETGFGQKEAERILTMIETLSEKESLADTTGLEISRRLFDVEKQMNPIDVIFWYNVFDLFGDLADYAEKVGNRLRLLLAQS
jgi:predicted phosphate transport protein (TIGR00153 family)